MDRRRFVQDAVGVAVGMAVTPLIVSGAGAGAGAGADGEGSVKPLPVFGDESVLAQTYPFVLPRPGYANAAIEPAVDATTMGIHHDTHHAAHVTSLNNALSAQTALHVKSLGELLVGLASLPERVRAAVRDNAGGHANHALFRALLTPGGAKAPCGALAAAIVRDFGSVAACTAALRASGVGQFGSGWTWLMRDGAGALTVKGSPNEDTPIADGRTPVVGIDVWEHAYYLKYQQRRTDYLDAVLSAINWDVAATQYGRA